MSSFGVGLGVGTGPDRKASPPPPPPLSPSPPPPVERVADPNRTKLQDWVMGAILVYDRTVLDLQAYLSVRPYLIETGLDTAA